jgi:hypothetical protein
MIFTPLFVKNFSLLLIFLIDSFGQFCMIVVLTSTNAISDYHHYNQWLTTAISDYHHYNQWLSPLQSDYHHYYNQWLSPLQSVIITTTISDYHHYNQWLTTTISDYHHYSCEADSSLQWGGCNDVYMIKFFIDLWQVCNFLLVLSVSSTNKTNCNNTGEILLKVALNTHIIPITSYVFEVLTLLRHQLLYG